MPLLTHERLEDDRHPHLPRWGSAGPEVRRCAGSTAVLTAAREITPSVLPWHHRVMVAIEVVHGDITAENVDALVTAANESLLSGGGVDGAIHQAAGPQLAEAGAAIGPCMPGDAMATPAFDLDPPVRHIIHTVGPVWEGGGYGEADVLASCYRRSLEVADGLRARSVAFPAIATGV